MTGMRKFWISIIWGALLIGILLVLILTKVLDGGMFIAWLTAFGGVFVFFITGNVVGDHIVDGALTNITAAPTPPWLTGTQVAPTPPTTK